MEKRNGLYMLENAARFVGLSAEKPIIDRATLPSLEKWGCASCAFFQRTGRMDMRGSRLGNCVRRAPAMGTDGRAAFPAVKELDHCGEYQSCPPKSYDVDYGEWEDDY